VIAGCQWSWMQAAINVVGFLKPTVWKYHSSLTLVGEPDYL